MYLCFVYSRMCNVKTYSFPEGTGYGIGRMYPAVGVQNILKRKKLVGYAELGIGKKIAIWVSLVKFTNHDHLKHMYTTFNIGLT